MPATVLYELSGHVATITLNRPDSLHAINGELRQDLNAAWNRFRGDDDAWGEAVRFGETMRMVAGATEDAAEGISAWAEGHPPDWQAQ